MSSVEPPIPGISTAHDATDRQIDRLVYALYGLSDEEIRTLIL